MNQKKNLDLKLNSIWIQTAFILLEHGKNTDKESNI